MNDIKNYISQNRKNVLIYTLVLLLLLASTLLVISKSHTTVTKNVGSNSDRIEMGQKGYIFVGDNYNLKVPKSFKIVSLTGLPDNPYIPIYEYQKGNMFVFITDNSINLPTEFSKTNKCILDPNTTFNDDSIRLKSKLFNNIPFDYLSANCSNGLTPQIQASTKNYKDFDNKRGLKIIINGTKDDLLAAKTDLEDLISSAVYK